MTAGHQAGEPWAGKGYATTPAGVTPGQGARDALESIVTAWRQEAEPRPADTQGQLISRHALGSCADELARFLANHSHGAIAAAQQPQPAPDLQVAGLRSELTELTDNHNELIEEILLNTGDEYDGDEAAEAIAVRYVRDLEAGTVREPVGGDTERPGPLCACAHTAARHVAEGCMEPECGCALPFRVTGQPAPGLAAQLDRARDVVREAIAQVESGGTIDPATLDRWHRIAVLGQDAQ